MDSPFSLTKNWSALCPGKTFFYPPLLQTYKRLHYSVYANKITQPLLAIGITSLGYEIASWGRWLIRSDVSNSYSSPSRRRRRCRFTRAAPSRKWFIVIILVRTFIPPKYFIFLKGRLVATACAYTINGRKRWF